MLELGGTHGSTRAGCLVRAIPTLSCCSLLAPDRLRIVVKRTQ
jgi:hypothetical protein